MTEALRRQAMALLLGAAGIGAVAEPAPDSMPLWRDEVTAAERSFARSMAERDHEAFSRHLSAQAVFWAANRVLHGRAEVAAGWRRFFEGPTAPFSWAPDEVQVLADGSLAHSSGPVHDAAGRLVARFNSIWRQEAPGVWRVVFDKGSPLSDAERASAARP